MKPWRGSTNAERLNPYNGILLAAHIDALFDKHLLTFNDDGSPRFSAKLRQAEIAKIKAGGLELVAFSVKHAPFLVAHRAEFDRKQRK